MKPPLLVLCATDLSEDADLATVAASDFARLFGSRLVLVHAVPYPAPAQVLFQEGARRCDMRHRLTSHFQMFAKKRNLK